MKTTRTLEEAQQQGYVVIRDGYDTSNGFFRWCEDTDEPFVRIRLKSTFAVVEVDLIGQTWRPTDKAGQKVVELLREYQVGNMPGVNRNMDTFTTMTYAHRVPIDEAPELASKIVAILREPTNRENDGSLARMAR